MKYQISGSDFNEFQSLLKSIKKEYTLDKYHVGRKYDFLIFIILTYDLIDLHISV